MRKFILGYDLDSNFEKLTEFKSVEDAEYNSEEWCFVEAENLEDAKNKYEETFEQLKKDGKINGCF